MKDLVDQKAVAQTNTLDQNQTMLVEGQVSFINDSPALATLATKLLKRDKRTVPHTYRRPTYLQYIDYA